MMPRVNLPPPPGVDAPTGPGPRRFGPYEVIADLDEGGMGLIFKARHVRTGDVVAVKTLLYVLREALPRWWVAEIGLKKETAVEVVRAGEDSVAVTRGLEPGAEVVTTGAFLLKTEILKDSIGAGCADD